MEIETELLPRKHQNIVELFSTEKMTNSFLAVSAPMVRYSKLEFRQLLRKYGVKLCFTPMIIADSFNQSENARHNEFTTNCDDQPLIAQFAAKSPSEFVTAAQLIYPYVDGVDLNCGCPQSWAIAKGYGCGLLKQPDRIYDILRTIRRTLPDNFSCSLKIRLFNEDVRSNVELARQLEHCGVTFLTIHGRTQWQKCSHPLNIAAMAEIKKSVHIPIIVNGNVRTRAEAVELRNATNGDGVMSARGLLANPALFDEQYSEMNNTPRSCIQAWLNIAAAAGDNISFQCFHHHLTFMWSKRMKRSLRLKFNRFSCKEEVFTFFDDVYDLKPATHFKAAASYTNCRYSHVKNVHNLAKSNDSNIYSKNLQEGGKFFLQFNEDAINKTNAYDLEESFFHKL